jgi:hypothetical protein
MQQNKKQIGMTLLISILIMSTVVVVTVTVAGFAIQELRNARFSALSEPSINAAESAAEQALWQVKRLGSDTFPGGCTAFTTTDGISQTAGSVLTSRCLTYTDAVFELGPDDPVIFYLYDPRNRPNSMQDNKCMKQYYDPVCTGEDLYNRIDFERQDASTAMVHISVTTLGADPEDVGASPIYLTSYSPSASVTWQNDQISSDDKRLKVTLESQGRTMVKVYPSGFLSGMPDYPTLDVVGCSASGTISSCNTTTGDVVKRRINITIPK